MDEAEDKLAAELNAVVRDTLLTHIRSMQAPWAKLRQSEQQDTIAAIEQTARDVVRQSCETIARRGFDGLRIQLKDLNVKDGRIKGKFEAAMTGENVTLLAEHENSSAYVVLADPADFMQGAWAKADPDQPEIPLESPEDEGEEAEDDQRRAPRRTKAAA
ncbi:hypothetical protein ASG43_03115 [Aureimonas sp. Leaf454]|uniref:hypothetical protein n=1 Tax=Aureimonas sp. Leaf454 TaxID=1736381 RepID=UPI000700EB3F|nr:hypothetical protein [Aureimonas sp. Leaf454]KQT54589.1 hypothetical protein ASG43_03115 [Aureimonas sp. Leaf454]